MSKDPGCPLGGYEAGYRACDCFWGREPGSLIHNLVQHAGTVRGLSVLDAGCGEGKNAAYLAALGASVRAIDVCPLVIEHAKVAWPDATSVDWEIADIRTESIPNGSFDVVIAYGLLHCLASKEEVSDALRRLQSGTIEGGYNVVCAFNKRFQDLRAHPGFAPILLSHAWYLGQYSRWETICQSDENLYESHPHNNVPHVHSITRLVVRKGRLA